MPSLLVGVGALGQLPLHTIRKGHAPSSGQVHSFQPAVSAPGAWLVAPFGTRFLEGFSAITNLGTTSTLQVKVWVPMPIVTILVLYSQMSSWIHCIRNTSGVYSPLALFMRVCPHAVSINASTSRPLRVTGKVKCPGCCSLGDPTCTPWSDLTYIQSICGQSA